MANDQPSAASNDLIAGPGEYYFNDDGLMVFTARYHLRRGYCCESGCRHCPYGYKGNSSSNATKDQSVENK